MAAAEQSLTEDQASGAEESSGPLAVIRRAVNAAGPGSVMFSGFFIYLYCESIHFIPTGFTVKDFVPFLFLGINFMVRMLVMTGLFAAALLWPVLLWREALGGRGANRRDRAVLVASLGLFALMVVLCLGELNNRHFEHRVVVNAVAFMASGLLFAVIVCDLYFAFHRETRGVQIAHVRRYKRRLYTRPAFLGFVGLAFASPLIFGSPLPIIERCAEDLGIRSVDLPLAVNEEVLERLTAVAASYGQPLESCPPAHADHAAAETKASHSTIVRGVDVLWSGIGDHSYLALRTGDGPVFLSVPADGVSSVRARLPPGNCPVR